MFNAREAQSLIVEANELIDLLNEPQDSQTKKRIYFGAWKRHYAAAVCYLLGEADRNSFNLSLIQCVSIYMDYLTFLQADEEMSARLIASETTPFLASIVTNNAALGSKLINLIPNTWNENYEYEDDFYYATFLFGFFENGYLANKQSDDQLDMLANALEGEQTCRLKICKALATKDTELFDDSLIDLHTQWFEFNKEKNTRLAMKDWEFLVDKGLFFEGLGLIKIAKRSGMDINTDCPDVPLIVI